MQTMDIDKLKIPWDFKRRKPGKGKLERYRAYWLKHKKQENYIVVDKNNVVVDGYIQYLILRENGVKEALVTRCKRVFVCGKHLNSRCRKEYIWELPSRWVVKGKIVEVGDILIAKTVYGENAIEITKVFESEESPLNIGIKPIVAQVTNSRSKDKDAEE